MRKMRVAIIGSGNIGMNLLYKIKRSNVLECSLFIGRNLESANLKEAKRMGYRVSADSIQAIIDDPNSCDIVFDATTAEAHKSNSAVLKKLGKFAIDLTPSKVGKICVPCLNWQDCIKESNVNMVTCGGQSMVPLAVAMKNAAPNASYFETVSTISSKSAGPGTRANVDEYVQTTREALQYFTKTEKTKAMIVLNPAEPPITMRNTLYMMAENPDLKRITEEVDKMAGTIEKYVPGFQVIVEPTLLREGVVAVTAQVEGSGDFLPPYAGNLDIITCAGVEIAERYACDILEKEGSCPF